MNHGSLIKTSRLSLFTRQSGTGSPLLFLGGSNFDMRLRAPVFDSSLVEHFAVAAYEPRGLARSDAPAGSWTMADYAEDAVGLMDALGWENAHILGESFGAMTALHLAISHPDRVKGLALAAGSPGGANGRSYPIEEFLELPARERAISALGIQDRRFNDLMLAEPLVADERITMRMQFEFDFLDRLGNREGYRKLLEARAHHDCCRDLHSIQASVLVMAGKHDGQADMGLSLQLAEKIPRARIRVYEGGHGFLFSSPEPVRDLLADWLDG